MIDDDIRSEFLAEAGELLSNAERCFLDLESSENKIELIDQLFRLAHNLKGSSHAVGFEELGDFTHLLESLLLKIKNNEIEISSSVVDLLLKSNDHLLFLVEKLRTDSNFNSGNTELSSKISDLLEQKIVSEKHVQEKSQVSKETASAGKVRNEDKDVRVKLSKIDHLLNYVGELVILQEVASQQKSEISNTLLRNTIDQMSKIVKEVQDISTGFRMMPLKQTFQKMHRIVRDTSESVGKDVRLEVSGEDTELDKMLIEKLTDPLVHIMRNSVDHGIESAQERIAMGKPSQGCVSLRAWHQGTNIVIEIQDDGKGLDAEMLTKKAIEKGILSPEQSLTKKESFELIFHPGFSTKSEVTDISGRGVGMDVVKKNIMDLQGNVCIESELGRGTCIKITLPLTLAIIDGLVVLSEGEKYVIPIAQIVESVSVRQYKTSKVNESRSTINLRGTTIPIHWLHHLLNYEEDQKELNSDTILIIFHDSGGALQAVAVDEILYQQQVVIKKISANIERVPGFSGASILGDGRVSFILELGELLMNSKNIKSRKQGASA